MYCFCLNFKQEQKQSRSRSRSRQKAHNSQKQKQNSQNQLFIVSLEIAVATANLRNARGSFLLVAVAAEEVGDAAVGLLPCVADGFQVQADLATLVLAGLHGPFLGFLQKHEQKQKQEQKQEQNKEAEAEQSEAGAEAGAEAAQKHLRKPARRRTVLDDPAFFFKSASLIRYVLPSSGKKNWQKGQGCVSATRVA